MSDRVVARYCGAEVEADSDADDATAVRVWGPEAGVREAAALLGKLLARSQIESR